MVKKKAKDVDVEDLEELDEDDSFDSDVDDKLDDKSDDFDDDLYDDGLYDDESQSPMYKHSDLLKDLTDFDPYLKESVNNWLGLKWDYAEEKYVSDDSLSPILSVQGVNYCISFLKTYTRGNNIITNISKDDYIDILDDAIEDVYINLGTREELGYENKFISEGDLIAVCNKLLHSCALILMGAGDGKYNQFLGTTITRNEVINPMQQFVNPMGGVPVKKGLIGKLREVLVGNQRNFGG